MDTAIAIRTAVVKDGMLYVQAGAGIVARLGAGDRVERDAEQGARGAARGRDGAAGPRRGRLTMLLLIETSIIARQYPPLSDT